MFTRTVSPADLKRLRHAREAADSAYNAALTRLDAAVRPAARLPERPAPEGADGLAALESLARRPPQAGASGGPFWRRWLGRVLAPALMPALERQSEFNRAVAEHLARTAAGRREERDVEERTLTFIGDELAALARFQSLLVQYAQQITPYVDNKGREVSALMRRITEDSTVASAGVAAGLEAVASAQRALDDSFDLLQASVRVMRRELHGLRPDPAPAGEADGPDPPGERPDAAAAQDEASVYVAFEDVFRGAHGDIAERQRSYLRYFKGASDVLDIGCGRGEFLELLRERGVAARGIDTNAEMVARCVERGLAVVRADALDHLDAMPEDSLGGIFSAQVVEHLEAGYLVRLLQAMHRVVRPGSRVVVETINPTSWIAYFSAYLRDITHRQPLHPDTLEYLLRAAGFRDVRIVYRSPPPAVSRLERLPLQPQLAESRGGAARELAEVLNRNVDRLNDLIFGDQDYAAIATRRG